MARFQLSLLVAALAVGQLAGCGLVRDESTSGSFRTLTYDDRLPEVVEDLFAQCHEPLVIGLDNATIDPAGDCDSADLSSVAAQAVLASLADAPAIDFSDLLPADLQSGAQTFPIRGFPWPMQNCVVNVELGVDLTGLQLDDANANWETHDGLPSLHVDFDPVTSRVAEGSLSFTPDCPSSISQAALNLVLRDLSISVLFTGMDLDYWVMLDHDRRNVYSSADARFRFSSIRFDTSLPSVIENLIDIQDMVEDLAGLTESQIESFVGAELTSAYDSDVASTVDDLYADDIDGDWVCDIDVVSGELVIKTDLWAPASHYAPCTRKLLMVPIGSLRVNASRPSW